MANIVRKSLDYQGIGRLSHCNDPPTSNNSDITTEVKKRRFNVIDRAVEKAELEKEVVSTVDAIDSEIPKSDLKDL